MRFPRALRRLLAGYLILHLLAAGIFVLVLTEMVRNQMIRDARLRMESMTTLLAQHIEELEGGLDDPSLLNHITSLGSATDLRFTLITSDGVVVADSITGTRDIGTHSNREEVQLQKRRALDSHNALVKLCKNRCSIRQSVLNQLILRQVEPDSSVLPCRENQLSQRSALFRNMYGCLRSYSAL